MQNRWLSLGVFTEPFRMVLFRVVSLRMVTNYDLANPIYYALCRLLGHIYVLDGIVSLRMVLFGDFSYRVDFSLLF